MKKLRKITAALSAFVICTTMTVGTFASTHVSAYDPVITVPINMYQWVPKSFEQSLEFYNKYGRTHIEEVSAGGINGSIICCVRLLDNANKYETVYTGDTDNIISTEIYTHEDTDYKFEVVTYFVSEQKTLNISHIEKYNGNITEQVDLTFEISENGTAKQTDIYGWLPDCSEEFEKFSEQYGKVSIHNNYVVYCDIVNYSAGMNIDFSQKGSGKLEQILKCSPCQKQITPIKPGTPSNEIRVYKPTESGDLTATWLNSHMYESDYEYGSTEIRSFVIDYALNVTASDEITAAFPSWIPNNFIEALDFDNKYGKTHINGEYICTVQKKDTGIEDGAVYATEDAGSSVNLDDCRVFQETYEFVWPDEPVRSDYATEKEYFDAHQEYENTLSDLRLNSENKDEFYSYFGYEVTVYHITEPGSLKLNWLYINPQTEQVFKQDNLSFEVSENGTITETDYYSWLPDCITEFYDFRIKHGKISVQNNFIVYCEDVCWDGGFSVKSTQYGDGKAEEILDYSLSETTLIPLCGGTGHTIKVYKPTASGEITLEWLNSQIWNPDCEGASRLIQNYTINYNLQIIDNLNNSDCNLDGTFGIQDGVALKKWLLTKNNEVLCNNADLNNDGIVNVFDYCLMRRNLMYPTGLKPINLPDYTVLEDEWINGQHVTEYSVFIAGSKDGFKNIIEKNEICKKENCTCSFHNINSLINENITDSLFEDKAAVVLYVPSGSSSRVITLDDTLTNRAGTLIVNVTTHNPENQSPDMRYKRIILLVNKNEVEDVTNIIYNNQDLVYDME